MDLFSDERMMLQALKEAQKAQEAGEVPVGAVVVAENRIIGRGHNQTETLKDPTAHAEMLAISAAFQYLGGKYLQDCTLYVTLEPCPMCAGALYWSQLGRLVYGAGDPKRGYLQVDPGLLHPRTEVSKGLKAAEAGELMTSFFAARRGKS